MQFFRSKTQRITPINWACQCHTLHPSTYMYTYTDNGTCRHCIWCIVLLILLIILIKHIHYDTVILYRILLMEKYRPRAFRSHAFTSSGLPRRVHFTTSANLPVTYSTFHSFVVRRWLFFQPQSVVTKCNTVSVAVSDIVQRSSQNYKSVCGPFRNRRKLASYLALRSRNWYRSPPPPPPPNTAVGSLLWPIPFWLWFFPPCVPRNRFCCLSGLPGYALTG